MKLQQIKFTNGIATLATPSDGVLRIVANDDLSYSASLHYDCEITNLGHSMATSSLDVILSDLFNKDGQGMWQDVKTPEKGLNLSQSAQSTQVGGDHYSKLAIQPMHYSMENGLDPLQHTIIKYVTRFRDKGGLQDLEKAKHCIDMLIEHEQAIDEMAFKHGVSND